MNTKERDITELLNQFNIQAEHIGPYVYKVINTSNEGGHHDEHYQHRNQDKRL